MKQPREHQMSKAAKTFKVAAVQATPIYLDLDATIEKTCNLIAELGQDGVDLAVFPETYISGYPLWVWFIPPGKTQVFRDLYTELYNSAISIPGIETDRLCCAAKEAGVNLAIGVNERNNDGCSGTLYNTMLYISAEGTILGKHRKLVPTGGERLVWGQGDGSDLAVYDLGFTKLGGLICWENYMPLARYSMIAWGAQIYAAPTWDRGEPWLSTLKHIAKEGRMFVIGCCSPMHLDDLPERLSFMQEYLTGIDGWINPGDSVIVNPDGKVIAGPVHEKETILTADICREELIGPYCQLDIAGHYARPDIFELRIHRSEKPVISVIESRMESDISEEVLKVE
jgi:nitrilase